MKLVRKLSHIGNGNEKQTNKNNRDSAKGPGHMTTYLESLYDLGWSVMASTVNPTQAFCRIVQNFPIKNNDGSVSFKPKTLGVGCVLRLPVEIAREFGYTGKKKCDCFIVANSQVVAKEDLIKVSTGSDPGSQIIAEFLGDGRDKPQNLRIVDITRLASEDIVVFTLPSPNLPNPVGFGEPV